jgi:trimethylamine--corrinoid protein Co-methyltransferase
MLTSYEKFILDDEVCGMCKRIKKGEQISDEKLAVALIGQVGPGGEYLTRDHTFENFKKEIYQPRIEERNNYDAWKRKGALPMERRANARWKEILKNYQEPGLPRDMDLALRKYIEKI